MSGYTKLFSSILASTIWREDMETRIVWITLLAMAGKDGIAEASVPGLADFARVSVSATRAAIAKLSAPDADSRSQEHEGRRIAPVDGGWLLLNHAKYRAKLGEAERREYKRMKQAHYRARVDKRGQQSQIVDTVDTKQKQKQKQKQSTDPILSAVADDAGFDAFWDAYPKKQAKKDTRMAWTKLAPSADLQQTILEAIAAHKTGRKWREGFAPMPATFLRGERWADVLETPALPIGAQPAGADNPCGFGCPHDPSCRSPWDCLALRRAAGETL